jgi:hypothetical protein
VTHYNTRGPEALVYQRTGGRPPHMMVWTVERPFDRTIQAT